MTLKEAKGFARSHGFSLTKRDGEYRVSRTGSRAYLSRAETEARSYYTDDLDDAIATIKAEAAIQYPSEGASDV